MDAIKTDQEKLHENLVFGTSEVLQSLFSKEDKILFLQEAVKGLVKKVEYADFLKYLAAEVCRDISIAEISESTGLAEKEVYSFLKFFEDICIIKKIDNYENIPERSKYYFLDNGVRNAILDDFRTVEERMDYEKLFENYVAMARVKQFPFETTSATLKQTKTKIFDEKVYSYSTISKKLFTGYYKENGVLIAEPEKALFDQVYLISKSVKSKNYLDEMDYTRISWKKFKQYYELVHPNTKNSMYKFSQFFN